MQHNDVVQPRQHHIWLKPEPKQEQDFRVSCAINKDDIQNSHERQLKVWTEKKLKKSPFGLQPNLTF